MAITGTDAQKPQSKICPSCRNPLHPRVLMKTTKYIKVMVCSFCP